MRRLALAALLASTLAACDSAEPGDDLVGTWTLTSAEFAYLVTSRTAQAVPDLSGQPAGSIDASGAVTARLDYVFDLFGDRDFLQLGVASENLETVQGPYAELFLGQYVSDGVELSGNLNDADGQTYGVYLETPTPRLTRDGGRFTLAPTALDGGVTVGGSLVYPEVALPPGEPAEVPRRDDVLDPEETVTFTFGEDGAFELTATRRNRAVTAEGTWSLTPDGLVRIGIRDENVTEFTTYAFRVDGGTLRLEAADDAACSADCVRSLEGPLFADPGSLETVAFLERYVLQAGGASARAGLGARPSDAASGARRPASTRPAGVIGRTLGH